MSGDSKVRYAGFWIRFLASMIDSFILLSATLLGMFAVLGILYWVRRAGGTGPGPGFFADLDGQFIQDLAVWIAFALSFVYYVWGHYLYSTTVGKKAFGVYVVPWPIAGELAGMTVPVPRMSLTQSVIREFATIVSAVLFYMGYVMAAFHPQKRALHDLLARTVSIRFER